MRRRFPLVDTINTNILRLKECGIIEKILIDVHRNSTKFNVPKKVEFTSQKKLNLQDMKIIGFLLIVGYFAAFITFLTELIVWTIKEKYSRIC